MLLKDKKKRKKKEKKICIIFSPSLSARRTQPSFPSFSFIFPQPFPYNFSKPYFKGSHHLCLPYNPLHRRSPDAAPTRQSQRLPPHAALSAAQSQPPDELAAAPCPPHALASPSNQSCLSLLFLLLARSHRHSLFIYLRFWFFRFCFVNLCWFLVRNSFRVYFVDFFINQSKWKLCH